MARAAGQVGVPYSFTALPGRYIKVLLEILQRAQDSEWGLVINPALDVQPDELSAIRAEFWESGIQYAVAPPDVILFQDYDEQILAYGWSPTAIKKELPLNDLRFLSGVDAALDAVLLNKLGFTVQKRMLRTPQRSHHLPALNQFRGMTAVSRYSAASRLAMLNGLLASSDAEWEACLDTMTTDVSLRRTMALAARDHVYAERTLKTRAADWYESIQRLVSGATLESRPRF